MKSLLLIFKKYKIFHECKWHYIPISDKEGPGKGDDSFSSSEKTLLVYLNNIKCAV